MQNCSLSIVGKDTTFTIFDDDAIKPYLDAIESDSRSPNSGHDDPPGPGGLEENPPPTAMPRDPQVAVAMETN